MLNKELFERALKIHTVVDLLRLTLSNRFLFIFFFFLGKGNITMTAEFNFYWDPEAAFIVLSELENKIVLLPWETCLSVNVPFVRIIFIITHTQEKCFSSTL